MLITDKNEIIESICKDLEEASDSAITQLAKTFSVPLQEESEFIRTQSVPALGSTWKITVGEHSFLSKRDRNKTVYLKVPVVKYGTRFVGETVIVECVLGQDMIHLRKVVNDFNSSSHLYVRKYYKNRHSSFLNDKKVPKTLIGRKVKIVGTSTIKNREVYSVEFEDNLYTHMAPDTVRKRSSAR